MEWGGVRKGKLAANRRRGVMPDVRTGRTRGATLDDVPLDVRERVG